jgi:hypothetical protein
MDAEEGGGAAEGVEERLGRPEADEAARVQEVERGGEEAADSEGEGVAHLVSGGSSRSMTY